MECIVVGESGGKSMRPPTKRAPMAEHSSATESHSLNGRRAFWAAVGAVFLGAEAFAVAIFFGLEPTAGVSLVILALVAGLWITEAVPLYVTSVIILLLGAVWLDAGDGGGQGAVSLAVLLGHHPALSRRVCPLGVVAQVPARWANGASDPGRAGRR